MMIPIGLLVVLALVFGGFSLSGGSFGVLLHALPFEGMMIAGASIGALIIASDFSTLKMIGRGLKRAFTGARWKRNDYRDVLILLYDLVRIYRNGGSTELEPHIENPKESSIFAKYPRIRKDEPTVKLISDAFRMLTLGYDNPHQLEEMLEKRIETNYQEHEIATHSLTTMADGLPAIGIVAAVLGVIKTMSAVDQPPEILGMMIGGALVGTFLGVFLAYCVVQPVAGRIESIEDQDFNFSKVIRDIIVAAAQQHSPQICSEIGRCSIPPRMRPSFDEINDLQRQR
jgi:chemotaxis protein MotA